MNLCTARNTLVAAVALISLATPPTFAASPSPLLETILTNYGGKEYIAGIQSITAKGQIMDFGHGKEGPYSRYQTSDHKLRTEALVTHSSSGDVRIYNNGNGWKNSGQKMQPIQGKDLSSLLAQYESFILPLTFLAPNISLSYDVSGIVHGHPVEIFILKLPKTPTLTIQLDAISMLVHRVEWEGQNDGTLAIEFSDYRFVDGVLFPFRLTNYAAEIKVSEISLSSITINGKLPATTFKP